MRTPRLPPGYLCHCADCAVADGNPAQPAPPCTARPWPWRCGSRAAVLEELASEQPASSKPYGKLGTKSGGSVKRPGSNGKSKSGGSGALSPSRNAPFTANAPRPVDPPALADEPLSHLDPHHQRDGAFFGLS